MGMPGPFSRSCITNSNVPAPNPNPDRWELLELLCFEKSHVMKVRYLDATNFEGIKILVFSGKYEERNYLDPHFDENTTPKLIARFRPDEKGWWLAMNLARSLSPPLFY